MDVWQYGTGQRVSQLSCHCCYGVEEKADQVSGYGAGDCGRRIHKGCDDLAKAGRESRSAPAISGAAVVFCRGNHLYLLYVTLQACASTAVWAAHCDILKMNDKRVVVSVL